MYKIDKCNCYTKTTKMLVKMVNLPPHNHINCHLHAQASIFRLVKLYQTQTTQT